MTNLYCPKCQALLESVDIETVYCGHCELEFQIMARRGSDIDPGFINLHEQEEA